MEDGNMKRFQAFLQDHKGDDKGAHTKPSRRKAKLLPGEVIVGPPTSKPIPYYLIELPLEVDRDAVRGP
jgi:hypothetical protein